MVALGGYVANMCLKLLETNTRFYITHRLLLCKRLLIYQKVELSAMTTKLELTDIL